MTFVYLRVRKYATKKHYRIKMISIKFNIKTMFINLLICLIGIVFFSWRFYIEYALTFKILIFLIIIVLISIIYYRIKLFYNIRSKNQYIGLIINENGIINNTNLFNHFIKWDSINDFKTGYFRTREIYIEPINVSEFPRKKYLGLYFNSKPNYLWINGDILDINKNDLMNILLLELKKNKHIA